MVAELRNRNLNFSKIIVTQVRSPSFTFLKKAIFIHSCFTMESLYKDIFLSLNDIYQVCNKVARNKGFALIIRIKKPKAKELRYIHLRYS